MSSDKINIDEIWWYLGICLPCTYRETFLCEGHINRRRYINSTQTGIIFFQQDNASWPCVVMCWFQEYNV